MDISAKSDYAVRAMLSLAAHAPAVISTERIAAEHRLPLEFVRAILVELRRAGIVRSERGINGGYALARPGDSITIGAIIRAVDGPVAEVRGLRTTVGPYAGSAQHVPQLWVAVRASLGQVLDQTTLTQLLDGTVPGPVQPAAGSANRG